MTYIAATGTEQRLGVHYTLQQEKRQQQQQQMRPLMWT
jgi:hypothetical protein